MKYASQPFGAKVVRRSVIAGSLLLGIVGCSGSSQPHTPDGTAGGSGSGGAGSGQAGAAGGPADAAAAGGAGGTSTGQGGNTTGAGGAAGGGGAAAAGTGGTSTGQGGSTTGTGGAAGGGGAAAAGTGGGAAGGGNGGGGGSAQAGTGGSGGGRDAGMPAGGGGASGASGGAGSGAADGGQPDGGSGPSSGCGKNTARPDRRAQQTISIGGVTRYYLLNVPSGATSTPLPLVFALHGYDMNNLALVDLYDFTAQSGNKAITVLPQGEGPPPGNTSHWGDQVLKSTWTGNAANYDFIQMLKADIESKYCVDTTRVFITGFSMGGFFTNSMACAHSDWFRGFAPVSGGGPGNCSNANAKPPVMIHHGTQDTIVTPDSGEATRDFWRTRNGCNTMTSAIYTGCTSYGACVEPVIYCVGNWDHTVSSTARANIWRFFDSLK